MRRVLVGFVILVLAAAGGFVAYASRHPALAPITPPDKARFDAKIIERGEVLASLGYCVVCHTKPGGEPLAGGLAFHTPFGTLHSTNISPDAATGIGAWSEAAFKRAMREGVDRAGRHLYPAFPYDHFTRVTDEDLSSLYAWVMTRKPARSTAPTNALSFPFDQRLLLAGWKLLFLETGPLKPDPTKDAAWNRGAYLVEGLGHCGSCHTPRNKLGALRVDAKFAGGDVDGWTGFALDGSSPSPIPWTKETLADYLIKGWSPRHGIAAGPMTPVVDLVGELPDEDIEAIATYILSFQRPNGRTAEAASAFAAQREIVDENAAIDPALRAGRAIFTKSCATCHRKGEIAAPLALTSTVNAPDPRNVIRIIRGGIRPPKGAREHAMPPFAWIGDEDLASLVAFLRAQFSRGKPWADIPAVIREVKEKK